MKNDASHEALKDLTALLKRCRFGSKLLEGYSEYPKCEMTSERCPQPEQRNCSANWSCLLLARWSATRYVTSIFGRFKFSATPVSQSKASIFQWRQRCKGGKSRSTQQGVLVYSVSEELLWNHAGSVDKTSRCLRLNVGSLQSTSIHCPSGDIVEMTCKKEHPYQMKRMMTFSMFSLCFFRRRRRRMLRCFKGFQGCRNLWPQHTAKRGWDHFDFHETQQFHKKIQRFKSAFVQTGSDSETFIFFCVATKLREELEFLKEKHPLKSMFWSKILKKIRLFWRVSLSKVRRVRRGQRGLMVKRATKIVKRVVFFPEKTSQMLFFKNFETFVLQ